MSPAPNDGDFFFNNKNNSIIDRRFLIFILKKQRKIWWLLLRMHTILFRQNSKTNGFATIDFRSNALNRIRNIFNQVLKIFCHSIRKSDQKKCSIFGVLPPLILLRLSCDCWHGDLYIPWSDWKNSSWNHGWSKWFYVNY